VNLPVADPQAGRPSQKINDAVAAPPPPAPQEMTVPVPVKTPPPKVVKTVTKPAKPTTVNAPAETESAFASRIAKLKSVRDASREEADFEKSLSKVKGAAGSKVGMPGASGAKAGSDYQNFIISLLREDFKEPENTRSNEFAIVKIKITSKGKVELVKILESSGNTRFNDYAKRSVYDAEKKFPPPPNGSLEFDIPFKPQGKSAK
jgi:colicin import membrane protein